MDKKDILIIASGIIILIAIIAIASFLPKSPKDNLAEGALISIITDKDEYFSGETLKVKIENNSENKICFSSCYPYHIQKKNGDWESYRYVDCPTENIADNCVNPKAVKAFELNLPKIADGTHRLAIEACLSCQLKELFKKEKNFFSNRFYIK